MCSYIASLCQGQKKRAGRLESVALVGSVTETEGTTEADDGGTEADDAGSEAEL